ncbi:Hyaluronan synthase [Turicibacter sanguinis]|nr:Hyaluronan synthase [Turicibacter sanguinis]
MLDKNIFYSIIVPIYNSECTLKECLDSIRNQTYENFEVILVNDGSKDNSGFICDTYSLHDNRFKVIHRNNSGVSNARNLGLSVAKGKYIIYIDSDDYIEKGTLEKITEVMAGKEYDLIMFGVSKDVGNESSPLYTKMDSNFYSVKDCISNLIKHEYINAPFKVYKKSLIDFNKITFNVNLDIGEDLLFNLQYFSHCNSFYFIKDILYHYTIRNSSSLTQKLIPQKYEKLMMVHDQIGQISSLNYLKNEIKDALIYIRLKNIYSCFIDIHRKDWNRDFSEKINYIKDICRNEKNMDYLKIKDIKMKILAVLVYTNFSLGIYSITKLIYFLRKLDMINLVWIGKNLLEQINYE